MNDSIGRRIINVLLVCAVIVFILALAMYFGLDRDEAIATGEVVAEGWKGHGDDYWRAKETADQITGKRHAWLITAIVSPIAFVILMYIRGAYKNDSEPDPDPESESDESDDMSDQE